VSTEREVGELRRQLADAQAQLAEAQAERDEAFSKGFEQVRRRCVAAEARAEQAEATIAAVQSLADEWERKAGPESRAWSVFGQQVVSVPFAVEQIRAALAAAGPSAPETLGEPMCPDCGGSGNATTFDGDDLGVCSTCAGTGTPAISDEPARCEHGQTERHEVPCQCGGVFHLDLCPGPAASGTPAVER